MEEDVIEATVRNAFTQGCERVFLVDNESPDGTVETAIAAGAELAESFTTARHDEHLRIRLMNDAVWRISVAEAADHVWWLWLDADEFPHGPRGLTIRDYLATLDRSFRIVGARP
jgi:glycosyltransferase involved in cell wall biosynthesis